MSEAEFSKRLGAMERRLTKAHQAVEAGEQVDLADINPEIEALCVEAAQFKNPGTAVRLAVLVVRLDALEASLNQRLASLGVELPPPEPPLVPDPS